MVKSSQGFGGSTGIHIHGVGLQGSGDSDPTQHTGDNTGLPPKVAENETEGVTVKMPLGMLAFHSVIPTSHQRTLQTAAVTYPSAGSLHQRGRPSWSSGLLPSAWFSPGITGA